ncbi:hypothetical protein [Desemzia sp. FAM 24101]|uniref:hypothetical protein n=1 Tax=unclassified Desemzia TaxID=2685243 RepID=UPI00388AB91B
MKKNYTKKKYKKVFGFIFCILVSFVLGSIITYFLMSLDTTESPEQHEITVEDKVSVSESNSADTDIVANTASQEKVTLITEPGFDAWVRQISKIQIPDYQLDPDLSNLGDSVTVIDKELSFNKREFLTSDGELSDKSTQKTITYVNGTKYFTISFMRNEENITNDFQGSDWLYFSQDDVYCVPLIMTYKNIIILTTLQDTAVPVDYREAIDLSILIVEKLENIEQF